MKASPPTSIASLLSPIPKEGVNMLLPSPSTLLFERSMGSLLSNFKGSVSDDQDMSSFFPAPMPSIVEEEDESMTASPFMSSSNMAKMSTPTLSTVSVSPAESASTPQLKNIISELDTNNASSSPFSREMALPTPSAEFKNPAFNYIVGSFLDSLESLSSTGNSFNFEGFDRMMQPGVPTPSSSSSSKQQHLNHSMLMLNGEYIDSMVGSASPAMSTSSLMSLDSDRAPSPHHMPMMGAMFQQSFQGLPTPMTSPQFNSQLLPSPLHRASPVARNNQMSPSMMPSTFHRASPYPTDYMGSPKMNGSTLGSASVADVPATSISGSPSSSSSGGGGGGGGGGNKKSFKCTMDGCTKAYESFEKLDLHMSNHPEPGSESPKDKPYKCEICPQTFSRSHDLKRHYYIHTQEKPYVCTRCRKGFSRRDALRRHERSVIEGRKVHCVPRTENTMNFMDSFAGGGGVPQMESMYSGEI